MEAHMEVHARRLKQAASNQPRILGFGFDRRCTLAVSAISIIYIYYLPPKAP